MRHRRGRARKHQIDELMVLVNRTIDIADELAAHPRLDVMLDHNRDLKLIPRNEPAVVALNIIQMWLSVKPFASVRVGDSLTLRIAPGMVQVHYPLSDDGDSEEASGDRRDSERTGSAVEGEGGGEEKWVSPSEYFANYFGKEVPTVPFFGPTWPTKGEPD